VTDPDRPLLENATWFPPRTDFRYSFVATIEVGEVNSDKQIVATTSNLSRGGCYVNTGTPFDPGTIVKLTIRHPGSRFRSEGHVAHSIVSRGMGICFDKTKTREQIILKNWLMQASGEAPNEPPHESKDSTAVRHRRLLIVSAIILGVTVALWACSHVLP
jgi:hypothetical protein